MQYKLTLVPRGVLIAAVTLGLFLAGQKTTNPAVSSIYFLSGTETADTDESFPVNLYQVGVDKKLRFVREIVSQKDGLHSIHTFGNVAFVAYPHIVPTTISVVHFDEPTRRDEVAFNPEGLVVIDSKLAMAELPGVGVRELLFLADATGNRTKDLLASVTGAQVDQTQRVAVNQWNDYAALRYDGHSGGPMPKPDLVAFLADNDITIRVFSHQVKVDTLPRFLRQTSKSRVPVIVAANKEYLVFMYQHTREELNSGELTTRQSEVTFVHDRQKGQWKELQIDGTCSRSRVFGSWLATSVQMWDPTHKPSPGTENQRNESTEIRPSVRSGYLIWAGKNCWIPGTLVLQNLSDHRKIRIETGQEDSEILWVGSETVLYRVNDTIYQARIVGDQIQGSSVVVKDEDVPEVHWVFWAN